MFAVAALQVPRLEEPGSTAPYIFGVAAGVLFLMFLAWFLKFACVQFRDMLGRSWQPTAKELRELVRRWEKCKGQIEGRISAPTLQQPPPEWSEENIRSFPVERILIVEHDVLVDLFVLNGFHREQRALVLSAGGYPEYVVEHACGILHDRVGFPVFLLHDASFQTPFLRWRIRHLPLSFIDRAVVVDIGLSSDDFVNLSPPPAPDDWHEGLCPVDTFPYPQLSEMVADVMGKQRPPAGEAPVPRGLPVPEGTPVAEDVPVAKVVAGDRREAGRRGESFGEAVSRALEEAFGQGPEEGLKREVLVNPFEGAGLLWSCHTRRGAFLYRGHRVEAEYREFPAGFPRKRFPSRINIVWKAPRTVENGGEQDSEKVSPEFSFRHDLSRAVEEDFQSAWAMAMYGARDIEFVYYTSDAREFRRRLEEVRRRCGPLPCSIEVHSEDDPGWEYTAQVTEVTVSGRDAIKLLYRRTFNSGEYVQHGRCYLLQWYNFPGDFPKEMFPTRLSVVWGNLKSDGRGLPLTEEQEAQEQFESALTSRVELDFHSVLAMSRTGESKREFVYYTSDPQKFVRALKEISKKTGTPPVRIYKTDDPEWEYPDKILNALPEEPSFGRALGAGELTGHGPPCLVRYAKFPDGFPKSGLPVRVDITWRPGEAGDDGPEAFTFESELTGAVENSTHSVFCLVRHRGDEPEWIFHTADPQEFRRCLEVVQRTVGKCPIEVRESNDPGWDHFHGLMENVTPFGA
jgi:hypothetical protein